MSPETHISPPPEATEPPTAETEAGPAKENSNADGNATPLFAGFGLLPLWLFGLLLIGVGPMLLWYLIPALVLCIPTLGIAAITRAVYRRAKGPPERRYEVARNAFIGLVALAGAVVGALFWRHHLHEQELEREVALAKAFVEASPKVIAVAGGPVEASLSTTRLAGGTTPIAYRFYVSKPRPLTIDVTVSRSADGSSFSIECIKPPLTGSAGDQTNNCER